MMTDSLAEVFSKYKQPTTAELRKVVVEIKKLQKSNASISDQGYYDRLQRASSWLAKATQVVGDAEATFIFLWIALDALSSIRPEVLSTEWWTKQQKSLPTINKQQSGDGPAEVEWFLWRICGLDDGRTVKILIEDQWHDIRMVLEARYIMAFYWSGRWRTEKDVDERIRWSTRIVKDAISLSSDRNKIYQALWEIVIRRLRTLRNQLFHGSATDAHSKRRAAGESELEAGSRLLEKLIWTSMVLMVSESRQSRYWPPSPYPRVGSAQHKRFDACWLPK